MAILKVARLGNPILLKPAEEVSPEEMNHADFKRSVRDMIDTIRDVSAAILSAPQVHVHKRVLVFEVTDKSEHPGFPEMPLTVLINPTLQPLGPERMHLYEGCLCAPNLRARVRRYRSVRVEGLERTGEPVAFEVEGIMAAIVQHGMDHLNGRIFLEQVEDLATLAYHREWKKYHHKGPWDRSEEGF